MNDWRRGWDSNPRYACAYSGFRDRPVQPLWHLSGGAYFTRSTRRPDSFQAARVRMQGGGDLDAAVGTLVVFQDRHERAADGKTGTVQCVHELGLALVAAEPRLHTPRLEGLEVAARRNLAIRILCGQPHFEIVGFRRPEPHVAGT